MAMELIAQEERWEASFANHDVSVSEQLVAEDFIGTSSTGKVGDKKTLLNQVRNDKNVYSFDFFVGHARAHVWSECCRRYRTCA